MSLHPNKSKAIIIGSKPKLRSCQTLSIQIEACAIENVQCQKILDFLDQC